MTGRRAFERYRCDLPLVLEFEGQEAEAHTADISLGGLFAIAAVGFEYGTEVTVRLRLPALKEETRIGAIVRWSKPDEGLGLQFHKLRAIQVWSLNQFFRGLESADAAE